MSMTPLVPEMHTHHMPLRIASSNSIGGAKRRRVGVFLGITTLFLLAITVTTNLSTREGSLNRRLGFGSDIEEPQYLMSRHTAREMAKETFRYAAIGAASMTAYRVIKGPIVHFARSLSKIFMMMKDQQNAAATNQQVTPTNVSSASQMATESQQLSPTTPPQPPQEPDALKVQEDSPKNELAESDAAKGQEDSPKNELVPTERFDAAEDLWPPKALHRPGSTVWYKKENITCTISKAIPPFTKTDEWLYEVKISEERTKQTSESNLDMFRPSPIKKGQNLLGVSTLQWDLGDGPEEVRLQNVLRKSKVVLFSLPTLDVATQKTSNTSARQLKMFAEHAFKMKLTGVDIIGAVHLGKMEELKKFMKEQGVSEKVIIPIADPSGELHRELGLGLEWPTDGGCPKKSQWFVAYVMHQIVRLAQIEMAQSQAGFKDANAKVTMQHVKFCK